MKMLVDTLEQRAVNAIRFLAVDAIERAQSGHPGLPLGAAPMAYVLWSKHLRFDPQDPTWANRDRFILSAGHGSMLLYALLHLTGFALSLEDIGSFRQWDSITPGHPERGKTPGVEVTSGPLGQGFANGVGAAIGMERMAQIYNRKRYELIDHFVYALVSDGDLMEGVSHEAASLAGHLRLGKLIYLYDDNRITIDGSTDLTFSEDRLMRFRAYGWHVQSVEDGNDLDAIDRAIVQAKEDKRPSLIAVRTHIGYGLPTKQDTAAAHGEPAGDQEVRGAKEVLGWPIEPTFYLPMDVKAHFLEVGRRGTAAREIWEATFQAYRRTYPELAAQFKRTTQSILPADLKALLPDFAADERGMSTRVASGKILNAIAPSLPELIGGSADLTPSNKTKLDGEGPFTARDRAARYIHFGVREHGMGGILNGLASYGGFIPYGGTFLVFSDYMRPTLRLAAMMGIGPIYIFTHDSIALGQDGPTHQPIEQLASLRAIPNLVVLRPGDANETAYAWLKAIYRRSGPTALILSRQSMPILDRTRYAPASGVSKGAYVLADLGEAPLELILMASGSELTLAVEAGHVLAAKGRCVRVVSFPSFEIFEKQGLDYIHRVLPPEVTARVAIEAASPFGWKQWIGDRGEVIGIRRFGASAPYPDIYGKLGFRLERIVEAAERCLASEPSFDDSSKP